MTITNRAAASSFEHSFSWYRLVSSLVTLGVPPRRWYGLDPPRFRGVGAFESGRYHPGTFVPETPYEPFRAMTDGDGFWAAKLIMLLDDAHLRAIIDVADLTDVRARAYLLETLRARQRKTARYWFRKLTPIDRFDVTSTGDNAALCFTDLAGHYGLRKGERRQFLAAAYDFAGKPLATELALEPHRRGRWCTKPTPLGQLRDGYTIFVIAEADGDGELLPPTRIHIARDRHATSRIPRVIGIVR